MNIIAKKPACILHHEELLCNCEDTPDWKKARQRIVHQLMEEYWQKHQTLPPSELIERWLGEWK